MNVHAEAWIDAYLDGELRNGQLRQAEAHLAGCQQCQELLAQRKALSALLQQAPAAQGLKSERQFAAEIGLRLPRRQEPERSLNRPALRAAWALMPIVLLLVWVFGQTVVFLTAFLETLPGAHLLLLQQAFGEAAGQNNPFSGLLGGVNILPLPDWTSLTHLAILAVTACLYAAWLAAWWAGHNQKQT